MNPEADKDTLRAFMKVVIGFMNSDQHTAINFGKDLDDNWYGHPNIYRITWDNAHSFSLFGISVTKLPDGDLLLKKVPGGNITITTEDHIYWAKKV